MIASDEIREARPAPAPVETVLGMALGYLLSRSLHVATELRIADFLSAAPKHIDELAAVTGAHRESLYRLLRTLAAHGVFAEQAQGWFVLTPAARLLQQDAMRDGVLLCGEVSGDGSWWNAVGALRHSVITGEPAFERQHGMAFFDYLKAHPTSGEWFDRGMANFAANENVAIATTYDFSALGQIVDVGGGQGGLLTAILARYPDVHGTLFDLPEVVRNAACLGDAFSPGRYTIAGGDFFRAVPPGGDVYVLKRILHDWSDDQCVDILRRCREAMRPCARLLVIDAVVPPGNTPHPAKVMDILMMVFARGRERTESEFRNLFAAANLQISRVIASPSALSVIEAMPD